MSYSRAWQLVDAMNQSFRKPLVESTTGGKKGGGAVADLDRARKCWRFSARWRSSWPMTPRAYLAEFEKRLK